MELKAINLSDIQTKAAEPDNYRMEKTYSKITSGEVFAERKDFYLNEFTLFVAHFNAIPNVEFYSLEAVLAVGYRVNSAEATQFRIWATNTLNEFIELVL